MRNWKRHQTSRYLVGNLVDRSDMDGRLACESIAESLCVLLWRGAGDSEHRAAWLASWHSGGEAFALLERIGQTASTRGEC